MTKHLTFLLFIGLAWGQENPDTLTYHNSPKFPGRFLGITFGGFKFEMIDKSVIKKTFINDIQELSINGFTIINNGRWVVPKKFVKDYQGNINQQSYDTYQIRSVPAAKQKRLKFTQRVTRMGLIGGCGLGMWFWLVGNWTTW